MENYTNKPPAFFLSYDERKSMANDKDRQRRYIMQEFMKLTDKEKDEFIEFAAALKTRRNSI